MLAQIFKTVLVLSAAGSALTLLLAATKTVIRKRCPPQLGYYIWVAALAVMVMPIPIETHVFHKTEPVQNAPYAYAQDYSVGYLTDSAAELAGALWLTGAVIIFTLRLAGYIGFAGLVFKNSEYESTAHGVKIYRTDMIDTPLVMGVFSQRLFIPISITDERDIEYTGRTSLLTAYATTRR